MVKMLYRNGTSGSEFTPKIESIKFTINPAVNLF